MRIAVDLDGVCYHWERTARYMLRRWYADNKLPHSPEMLDRESRHWDDIEQNVSKEAWKWLWTEGVRNGLFRHGHIVGGTIEVLTKLAEGGHEIVIATARPKAAVGDTLAWCALHFHRIPIADIRIHDNKLETPADLYIDDGWHNITAISAAQKRGILFDRPWNGSVGTPPGITRCYGWWHILQEVRNGGERTA